ncbi:MAG: hypothetical protein HZC28_05840 [Spirochaetes bacterium]|nr:hypothetical protein [Spirochaetota bacterium]
MKKYYLILCAAGILAVSCTSVRYGGGSSALNRAPVITLSGFSYSAGTFDVNIQVNDPDSDAVSNTVNLYAGTGTVTPSEPSTNTSIAASVMGAGTPCVIIVRSWDMSNGSPKGGHATLTFNVRRYITGGAGRDRRMVFSSFPPKYAHPGTETNLIASAADSTGSETPWNYITSSGGTITSANPQQSENAVVSMVIPGLMKYFFTNLASNTAGDFATMTAEVIATNAEPETASLSLSNRAGSGNATTRANDAFVTFTLSDADDNITNVHTLCSMTSGMGVLSLSNATNAARTVFVDVTNRGTFTVYVVNYDDYGGTNTTNVSFSVTNDAPIISSFTATTSDSPDGASIAFSLSASDPENDDRLTNITVTTNGTEYCSQDTIDTLNDMPRGSYYIVLRVTDSYGAYAEAVTNISIGNHAPAITNVTVVPALRYPGTPITLRCYGRDADGDTVTYDIAAPAAVPATAAHIADGAPQSITYAAAGMHTVTVTAGDGNGGSVSSNILIIVSNTVTSNAAPSVASFVSEKPLLKTKESTRLIIAADDPNTNIVGTNVTIISGGGIISNGIGGWWYLAPTNHGTATIRMTVTDGGGLSASADTSVMIKDYQLLIPSTTLPLKSYFGASVAQVPLRQTGGFVLAGGAPGYNHGYGAVYLLFTAMNGTLVRDVRLNGPSGPLVPENSAYGTAVAACGLSSLSLPERPPFPRPVRYIALLAVGAVEYPRGCGAVYLHKLDASGTVRDTSFIGGTSGYMHEKLHLKDRFGSSAAFLPVKQRSVIDLSNIRVSPERTYMLAVGAPGDDTAGDNAGAVWIIRTNAFSGMTNFRIVPPRRGFSGVKEFGRSLAALGDVDGDGFCDLAVGYSGGACILTLDKYGSVIRSYNVPNAAIPPGSDFGCSLAGIGDIMRNGTPDMLISAKTDGDGSAGTGAVWFQWLKRPLLTFGGMFDGTIKVSAASGGLHAPLTNAHFGSSAALAAHRDNDVPVIAAGAENYDSMRGALWLLYMNRDGTVINW